MWEFLYDEDCEWVCEVVECLFVDCIEYVIEYCVIWLDGMIVWVVLIGYG